MMRERGNYEHQYPPGGGGISRCHLGKQYEKMSKNNEDGGKKRKKLRLKVYIYRYLRA
jgi:hypothetical protein